MKEQWKQNQDGTLKLNILGSRKKCCGGNNTQDCTCKETKQKKTQSKNQFFNTMKRNLEL